MIRDSWHPVQAVVTLACIGPSGRAGAGDCAKTMHGTVSARVETANILTLHMNLHRIDGVVEIAAGVPDWRRGLHAAFAVGSAGRDRIFARLRRLPRQAPHAPRVARVLFRELCALPAGPAIYRNLDLLYVGLTRPCDSLQSQRAQSESGAISRTDDQRLHIEFGDWMSVLWLHNLTRLYQLVRQPISGIHEVTVKFFI